MMQGHNLKIELRFRDRIGIVADIADRIARQGLNIVSMEVLRRSDEAHVFVELENGLQLTDADRLFDELNRIPDLVQMGLIDTLPQEERENRFRVVLDNISDGVVSIDTAGRLTTINKVAARALGCRSRDVLGKPIAELGLPDESIVECLSGRMFTHVKQNLITEKGRFEYFTTGRPIRDARERIIGAVEIAKDMQEIRKLARSLSDPQRITFSDIVGRSAQISEAVAFAQKVAPTDALVSISGESGTGKELFARAIHTASGCRGAFIPVNCAALPDHLLESELFGYVGGAFTGGKRQGSPGLFEIAHDGTVFLDEIADMSQGSQAKILRLIQERSIRRIGGSKEIPVNARIITATNKNLKRLVEEKAFRQDLFYRINVLPLRVPPLRERMEDIPALVEHFLLLLASRLGQQPQSITPLADGKLMAHDWPGNVRELKNVVERAAILCDGRTIERDCILFSHELETKMRNASRRPDPQYGKRSLKEQLATLEKELIQQAMAASRTIRGAARSLQISHSGLIKKLRKYRIQVVPKETNGS